MTSASGTSRSSARTDLTRLLERTIEPVPLRPFYRLGLIAVAALMILLPIIYFALVGGLIYLLYIHATRNFFDISKFGGFFLLLFAYLLPLLVLFLLIIFMLKPFFMKKLAVFKSWRVTQLEEPALYKYVHRLCEIIGARQPAYIEVDCRVNASARFDGLFGGNLVLTVGLPLVHGLTLQQFSGVLAHELGHFSQGAAMRLNDLVRRMNFAVARMVFERDAFDYWLLVQTQSGQWTAFITGPVRGMIWISRWILFGVMWVGQAVSSFLLRQMEFDADRYEARVEGSDCFLRTSERLAILNVAAEAAFYDLSNAWRERRLCDDFSEFVLAREKSLRSETLAKVHAMLKSGKTGRFDTHPCHIERVANAKNENAPGIISSELSATKLFSDFAELSKLVTISLYQEHLGKMLRPEHLVPTQTIAVANQTQREHYTSLQRFFRNLLAPARAVFPESNISPSTDPDSVAEKLLILRSSIVEHEAKARKASKDYWASDEKFFLANYVKSLRYAGVLEIPLEDKDYKHLDESEARAKQNAADEARAHAEKTFGAYLQTCMQHVVTALSLHPAFARKQVTDDDGRDVYDIEDDHPLGSLPAVWQCLTQLRSAWRRLENARVLHASLQALLPQVQPGKNDELLVSGILSFARKLDEATHELHSEWRELPYPYESNEGAVTLARYSARALPITDNVFEISEVAGAMIDSIYTLYMRILSDLASAAEEVEDQLGLSRLPEPAPPEEES